MASFEGDGMHQVNGSAMVRRGRRVVGWAQYGTVNTVRGKHPYFDVEELIMT